MVQSIQTHDTIELNPAIQETCGKGHADTLMKQIQASRAAMVKLFESFAEVGKCAWPHGTRSWSRINCMESIYYELLQKDEKPGILQAALSFVAYYSFRLDEILHTNWRGALYLEEFGIEAPKDKVSLLPLIIAAKDKPMSERWSICMQMLATHRAFERAFERIEVALKIWLRSYSRAITAPSIRTSWWPCQKIYYKLDDYNSTGHAGDFCKDSEWDGDESNSCEKAKEFKGNLWPETAPDDEEGHH